METDAKDKTLTIIVMVEELAQVMVGAKELQDDFSCYKKYRIFLTYFVK
jgi:hypothetical protein